MPVFAKMTPNVTNIVTIARAGITTSTTITITMYITIIITNLLSPGWRR